MRIALLEDDAAQAQALAGWLAAEQHIVHSFTTTREFARARGRESFDLYIIDWMLPDGSGYETLHWLRGELRDAAPVIFVTSRDAEEDIAAALDAGADDYMVKPVRQRELLARIEAVSRRSRAQSGQDDALELPPYRFEPAGQRLLRAGEPVRDLTDKEFQLALFLFRNVGRLLSRGHLLEAVWGLGPAVPTRTLDTHMSRIRRKLELQPANGFRIAPVYNFGYRLERLDAASSG